ncbi:MAG: hypothetical protein P1V97_22245 [Planctomycetota bacterium]|nr:hypothetical protein [Planctomycetota bacterium]
MKKFILGLIVGLIVGPLATLLIVQNLHEQEESGGENGAFSGQKRKRKPPEGLDGARLRLRSRLDGKTGEKLYSAHIDFLDGAIFDRDWSSVSAVANSLRGLRRGKAGPAKVLQAPSGLPSANQESQSMALLQHEFQALRFWREFFLHENEALTIFRKGKKSERTSLLRKLLKTTAETDEDQRNKRDAAYILGRFGGDAGLRSLSGFVLSATGPEDWRLGTEALGRSQNSGALAILQGFCDESREESLQKLALAGMAHLKEVTMGSEASSKFLGELLSNPRRSVAVRVKGMSLLESMDLAGQADFQRALVKAVSNTNEDPEARSSLVRSLRRNAQTNLGLPKPIVRGLERIAKGEQDSETRCEVFKALEHSGTQDTLKVLLDSEATVADPKCRAALKKCRATLTRRFGEL